MDRRVAETSARDLPGLERAGEDGPVLAVPGIESVALPSREEIARVLIELVREREHHDALDVQARLRDRFERNVVPELVDLGLACIRRGVPAELELPRAAREAAADAASIGVPVGVLVARYDVGTTGFFEIVADCIRRSALSSEEKLLALEQLRRIESTLFRFFHKQIVAIHGLRTRRRSPAARRAQAIDRALSGEEVRLDQYGYEIGAHHVAVIARGAGAEALLSEIAAELDRALILDAGDESGAIRAWLGGRREVSAERVARAIENKARPEVWVSVGSSEAGARGFAESYRKAQDVDRVALLDPRPVWRYRNAAILSALLSSGRAQALIEEMLGPLDGDPRREEFLETLRACVRHGGNAAAAAKALGLAARTVRDRMAELDKRLPYPIKRHYTELAIALRLDALLNQPRER
jgi:hypothetical protein